MADRRTDGQTDRFPLSSTGLLPIRAAALLPLNLNHIHNSSTARVTLTTYCLWAAILFFFFLLPSRLLGAAKHLYNRLCPLVGLSVCNAFVRRSKRRTYWPTWPYSFFFFNFFVCFTTLYATFRGLILRPFNTFLFVCPYVCLSVRLSVSPTYSESYAQCWIFFCSLFTKPLILSDSFTHDRPPQICLTWTQTLTIATCSTSYVKDYRSPSYQHQQTATIRIKVRRRN